jgi:hypothetical protein
MKRALTSKDSVEELERYKNDEDYYEEAEKYRKNIKKKIELTSIHSDYGSYIVKGQVLNSIELEDGVVHIFGDNNFKKYIIPNGIYKTDGLMLLQYNNYIEQEFILLYETINFFVKSDFGKLLVSLSDILKNCFLYKQNEAILMSLSNFNIPNEIITLIIIQYKIQEFVRYLHRNL